MNQEPALLWKYFESLCLIPRGSRNEAGVRAYIRGFADALGAGFQEDAYGNCVVSVPGRGRGKDAPAVIIQAHSDMVCVPAPRKEEPVTHDFSRDPIRTRVVDWPGEGGAGTQKVLMGTGTTLGADNGIGLVAGLAAATDPALVDCPPLELLVTVEEEIGLVGARNLDPALLWADILINLDTEELGDICVSCAGGRDMVTTWPLARVENSEAGEVPVRFFLTGLPGGHSGITIHERRGNAIVTLIREFLALEGASTLRVASISGGSARNVIPGNCEVVAWVPEEKADQLLTTFRDAALLARIREEVEEKWRGPIACGAERVARDTAPLPLPADRGRAILAAIVGVPHGVQAWSEVVEGLVETSNNVAVVGTETEEIRLQCATRSSRDGAIENFQEAVAPSLEASGATVAFSEGYPGWPADADSVILQLAKRSFEAVLGKKPNVVAVHAGLECGVFKGKRPSLEMVSFGPDIRGAHTIEERILIDSVPPFYSCLTHLLSELAQQS